MLDYTGPQMTTPDMKITTYNPLNGALFPVAPSQAHPQALVEASTDCSSTQEDNTKPESPQVTQTQQMRPPQPTARKIGVRPETPMGVYPLVYTRMVHIQKDPEYRPSERRRPPRLSKDAIAELKSLATERDSLATSDQKLLYVAIIYLVMVLLLIDYPLLAGTNILLPPLICAFLTGFIVQSHHSTNSTAGNILTKCSVVHFIFILIVSIFIELCILDEPLYIVVILYTVWSVAAVLLLANQHEYIRLFFDYDKFTRAASDLIDMELAESKGADNNV